MSADTRIWPEGTIPAHLHQWGWHYVGSKRTTTLVGIRCMHTWKVLKDGIPIERVCGELRSLDDVLEIVQSSAIATLGKDSSR